MTEIITMVSGLVTGIISWVGEFLTMVQAQPLLFIFVGLAIATTVIAMVRSWIPGNV